MCVCTGVHVFMCVDPCVLVHVCVCVHAHVCIINCMVYVGEFILSKCMCTYVSYLSVCICVRACMGCVSD